MAILIVGGGAIGCLMAVRLANSGHDITVLDRPGPAATLRKAPLRLVEADGRVHTAQPSVVSDPKALRAATFDLAVFAVKAFDTAEAAAALQPYLSTATPVLSVQNGVGNEDTLAAALPGPVLAGSLTTPVEVLGLGQVRVARQSNRLAVAPWRGVDHVQRTGDWFAAAGFTVQRFDDGPGLKWAKLLMNMVANAQAAILGLTPREIFAQPDTSSQEVRAWREAFAVLKGLSIRPAPLAGYPLAAIGALVTRLPVWMTAPLLGRFMVGARGDKPPSLALDLQRGRKQSEVEWLNGAVAKAAHKVGIPAPINYEFSEVLSAMARGDAAPPEFSRSLKRGQR